MANDKVVLIPTYNESDTIKSIVSEALKVCPDTDIIVIDDSSPDGTGEIAGALTQTDKRIKCIHRKHKEGLGPAYIEGFKTALQDGYKYIAHMDADFSHDPKSLPEFFEAIKDCDLVIGSRYTSGGGVKNWGITRQILSRFGSFYAGSILGININDLTGGFKCYRRAVLESIDIDTLASKGYAFLIEMTYRAYKKGFRIKEIPIIFTERRAGQTKMSGSIIFEAMMNVWKFRKIG